VADSAESDLRHDPLAALKQPPFVLYTLSRVGSAISFSLLQAVLAWQVYELTGSALSLGFLGLARFVPSMATAMLGGAVADAYDRRTILIVAKLLPFTSGLVLAVSTIGGWISMELIYGLVMLQGIAAAFEGPARVALLPAIVRPETFENAVTVSNTFQKLASVTGPTLGGLMIAVLGTASGYLFYCVAIIVSLVPLFFLRYKQDPKGRQGVSLTAIKEGVTFVKDRQVLLGAMTLDMFAFIFGGAQALLPVYAKDILHVGPAGYGLLSSSLQIGAVAMSLILIVRPPVERTGRALIGTVIVFGLLTVAFGLSRSYALSVLLYALIGAADQVSVVMRQTTIQMATPDALRGRVSSVNQVFVGASTQIGAVRAGFVAAVTGATFAVWSGGLMAVGVALLVAWKMPELLHYEIPRGNRRRAMPQTAAPTLDTATGPTSEQASPRDEAVTPVGTTTS
jgi:MFS family permease